MMRLNSASHDLDKNKFVKLVRKIFKWCKNNYGMNENHPIFKWKVIKNTKESDVYGIYILDDNCIEIYWNNMNNVSDIILTCIHEYNHYLQQPYRSKYLRVAYSHNIYQRKAEHIALKDYKKCWKQIKTMV
jgi:Zn-dependent peptidase ImmA (M78 family)